MLERIIIGVGAAMLLVSAVLLWRRAPRFAQTEPPPTGVGSWIIERAGNLLPTRLWPAAARVEAAAFLVIGLVLLASVLPTDLSDEATHVRTTSEEGALTVKNAFSLLMAASLGLLTAGVTIYLLTQKALFLALVAGWLTLFLAFFAFTGIALMTGHSDVAFAVIGAAMTAIATGIFAGWVLISVLAACMVVVAVTAGIAEAVKQRRASAILPTLAFSLWFALPLAAMWLFVVWLGVLDRQIGWIEDFLG